MKKTNQDPLFKTNKPLIIFILLLSIVFNGCKINFEYVYHTSIKELRSDSLMNQFEDENVIIDLYSRPNGVFFQVYNKGDKNLYLLWDQSYFIDPDGNSSRALNTDILETKGAISSKESYESIIPKKGFIKRFTSSATNVSVYRSIKSTIYSNDNYSEVKSYYNETFRHSAYWRISETVDYGAESGVSGIVNSKISSLENHVKNYNNLGLGLAFRKGNDTLEYDFRLPIESIDIYHDYNNYKQMKKVESIQILPEDLLPSSQKEIELSDNEILINKIKFCSECTKIKSTLSNDFNVGDVAVYEDNNYKQQIVGIVKEIKGGDILIETYPSKGSLLIQTFHYKRLFKVHYSEEQLE